MRKFTVKKIDAVKGRQVFEELVVNFNDGQLSEFEKELIGTTYMSEFKTILSYMCLVADLNSVPTTKFKILSGVKDGIKEYEFKSKHLRVYCIQKENGKIVVLGGKKTNQKSDIIQFRSIKKEYLQSLKK